MLLATTLVVAGAASGLVRWPSMRTFTALALVGILAQLGGNGCFQWSMSQVGLALTVPLCAGTMIIASSILGRALAENVPDDKLVGVLYLLGTSAEAQGNMNDALSYYQRVFIVDIQFRDIAERLSGAERAAR